MESWRVKVLLCWSEESRSCMEPRGYIRRSSGFAGAMRPSWWFSVDCYYGVGFEFTRRVFGCSAYASPERRRKRRSASGTGAIAGRSSGGASCRIIWYDGVVDGLDRGPLDLTEAVFHPLGVPDIGDGGGGRAVNVVTTRERISRKRKKRGVRRSKLHASGTCETTSSFASYRD